MIAQKKGIPPDALQMLPDWHAPSIKKQSFRMPKPVNADSAADKTRSPSYPLAQAMRRLARRE